MQDTYVYEAYSQIASVTGTSVNPFRFVGAWGYCFDAELATCYARARHFDPRLGRWTNEDPIGYKGKDVNLYRYVFNNPIRYIDPSGLKVYWCVRDMDGLFLGNHHFIKVVPDNPNDFKGQLIDLYGGEQGMTLGGFKNGDSCLEYRQNNQGDVAGTREANDPKRYKRKPNPHYYKSGWDVECHEISSPGGMTDTQFIQSLSNGANNFAKNKKKCKYKLAGPNCASWVNSLLESVGVPEKERLDKGEFDGIDWGEKDCCPNDMFK